MSVVPKKKFDFFNGGRGVDMRGEEEVEVVEDRAEDNHEDNQHRDMELPLDCYYPEASCYSVGQAYATPCSPPPSSHIFDYQCPSPGDRQSPPGYCGVPRYRGALAPPTTMDLMPPVPQPSLDPSEDDRRKGKRKQQCRLCAMHNKQVEVRGHKWYCPYREAHNCDKCEGVRKKQYLMKEKAKLNREQEHFQQCMQGPHPSSAMVPAPSQTPIATANPQVFPRLDELIRETSNIININEELFEKINRVVRPRSRDHPAY